MGTIYLYHDEGVSAESLRQTILLFKKFLNRPCLRTINAKQVKDGLWAQDAMLFVMPGGADLFYIKKLNGQANQIIEQYVISGGAFLGICAGSYYASSYVEFDKNGPLEVLGARELAFFKGKAIGPCFGPYDDKTQIGSRAVTLHTIFPRVRKTTVFYNGGGFFPHAAQYPNTKIIATYDNDQPAIVFIRHGQGKVLLSGAHFEFDPAQIDSQDSFIKKIIKPLSQGNSSRQILVQELMGLLL